MQSFGRRAVALAKGLIYLAGGGTMLCLTGVVGWQAAVCLRTARCQMVSLAQVFEAAGFDMPKTYFTASVDSHRHYRLELPDFIEQFFDVPVAAPLLFALVFLALFYVWIRLIEMGLERG